MAAVWAPFKNSHKEARGPFVIFVPFVADYRLEGGTAMSFYEKGPVRIHYEEAGSGFPLLLIAGGGLNSTISGLRTGPFNAIEEFKGEYRCIAADLRNANTVPSSGPLEIKRA